MDRKFWLVIICPAATVLRPYGGNACLIDVSSLSEPQLYVENELSSHDLFARIGVQLLQFSVFSLGYDERSSRFCYEVCAEPSADPLKVSGFSTEVVDVQPPI